MLFFIVAFLIKFVCVYSSEYFSIVLSKKYFSIANPCYFSSCSKEYIRLRMQVGNQWYFGLAN